jgi:tetratricopeptide (TPR) repeat protein
MFRYLILPVLAALQAAGQTQTDLLNEAKDAVAAHDYEKAAEQFRAASDGAAEPEITLDALRRLAAVSRLLGHPDEAERALLRAAPIAAKLNGDTSLELASVLSDLSGSQRALRKQKEALLSLESALRMRELHPAEQLADYSSDLLRTSAIRIDMGETGPAKDLLTRAVVACEKALPPESAQCTGALDALAGVIRDRSEYSEAEPLYVRLLRLREAAFGADSAELISTLDSLSYVLFGLKRYADAQPVYERLLALWEASAGSGHPMIALTLDKMAEFFAAQDRYDEAEPLVARAAAIRTQGLIESLKRSGRIQASASKLEEAAELYRRALLLADESKAADTVVDPILRAYAGVLRDLDRGAEAAAVEQRIAAILAKRVEREGRREAPVPVEK